jgi:hypothetical protein
LIRLDDRQSHNLKSALIRSVYAFDNPQPRTIKTLERHELDAALRYTSDALFHARVEMLYHAVIDALAD